MQLTMKLRISLIGLVFFALSSQGLAASRSDLAKEKRWEEQIVPSLLVGEAVKLKAAGVEFLALYAENDTDKALGGVILIHGMGAHPAWPAIIEPLRMALPEAGWHTLSLQMPILKNEAEFKEYLPLFDEAPGRIQAGVDYLKTKGIKRIAIIGHSMGNSMTTYYLASKKDPAVRAFIGIAFGPGHPEDPRTNSYKNFSTVNIPTLDIYGSNDSDWITKTARKRKNAAKKAGNKKFQQLRIEGANHFFSSMEDVLLQRIRGWLKKNTSAAEK